MGVLCGVGAASLWTLRPTAGGSAPVLAPVPPLPAPPEYPEQLTKEGQPDTERVHAFRVPSGEAPALACEEARAVVMQARTQLAYSPDAVDAKAFADATADWLDPYGLWSVAPDTPVGEAFDARAVDLLADVEGKGTRDCLTARALGAELVAWVEQLRVVFDEARGAPGADVDLASAAATPAFEGSTVTRPARALAATLGRHVGVIERALGPAAHPYVDAARARYFPSFDADGWARVILASAVRAYVPSIDPHGAWAPLDEESSVYEVDLEARPPARLWEKSERTAVGVRIESGAAPPLADGDVLLSLAGVPTAGLSFEQSRAARVRGLRGAPPRAGRGAARGREAPGHDMARRRPRRGEAHRAGDRRRRRPAGGAGRVRRRATRSSSPSTTSATTSATS